MNSDMASENEKLFAARALVDVLKWSITDARDLVDQMTDDEIGGILFARRESCKPAVGIASNVYRARMRLAKGQKALEAQAEREADRHFRDFIKLDTTTGRRPGRPRSAPQPPTSPFSARRVYRALSLENDELDE